MSAAAYWNYRISQLECQVEISIVEIIADCFINSFKNIILYPDIRVADKQGGWWGGLSSACLSSDETYCLTRWSSYCLLKLLTFRLTCYHINLQLQFQSLYILCIITMVTQTDRRNIITWHRTQNIVKRNAMFLFKSTGVIDSLMRWCLCCAP